MGVKTKYIEDFMMTTKQDKSKEEDMNEEENIEISNCDKLHIEEWMILPMVQNAVYRRDFIVNEISSWIINNWSKLTKDLQRKIQIEVERTLNKDYYYTAINYLNIKDFYVINHYKECWELVTNLWVIKL